MWNLRRGPAVAEKRVGGLDPSSQGRDVSLIHKQQHSSNGLSKALLSVSHGEDCSEHTHCEKPKQENSDKQHISATLLSNILWHFIKC